MQESEIYAGLAEIFENIFMRDDIQLRPELTAKDVQGWDSFAYIEIVLALQEKYGVKFHTKEFDDLKNVQDLVNLVLKKKQGT